MPGTPKFFLWLIILFLLVASATYAYKNDMLGNRSPNVSAIVENPVMDGQMARITLYEPRKSMPSLLYLAGLERTSSLRNFKGQWTLVNLWAAWCPPCLKELPSLQRLNDMYASQGFQVVAISLDAVPDTMALETIVSSHKLGSVARNWDHTGELLKLVTASGYVPVSFIVDPEGKVFGQLNGEADWASPDAQRFVDSLLKKPTN